MRTAAQFNTIEEAYVAKGLLEAAGIEVFIDDAKVPEGGKIEIIVPPEDQERAQSLIKENQEIFSHVGGGKEFNQGRSSSATTQPPPHWLSFIQGGALFLLIYLLLTLVFIVLGGRLPWNAFVVSVLFLLGGLTGIVVRSRK